MRRLLINPVKTLRGFNQTLTGFTLIELLVTIAVIGIVSSVVLMGKSQEDERLALKLSAFTLSQNIREIQEKALAGEDVACPNPSNKPCGFGMHFETNKDVYTPFIDCSNDCGTSNRKLTGADKVLPDVSLGKKVKICSLPVNAWDLAFSPPDPAVYLDSVKWGTEAVITLCLKSNPSQTKNIRLNNAGKIEIE
ncbi:MAG: type II secretion system protein [Candidatus Pacebacteria bacterium]|nr:type II secretion system protein [Candidatus Paceibacterota bacterium]